VLTLKLCSLALLAAVGGASTAPPCVCQPETETISCTDGVSSFGPAACTQVQLPDNLTQVTLLCPPGHETAISAGFRHLAGPFRPLLEMSPLVPAGPHPIGYRFIWRARGGTDLKVYVTCQAIDPPPPAPAPSVT
jgi:hypothetical protein